MDRWDRMMLRAYAPVVGAMAMAIITAQVLGGLQAHPLLAAIAATFRWLPIAVLLLGSTYAAWITYRLWRARHGVGLLCDCGGLLGMEREGRADRGGAYRCCYACGRNLNHRHYS